MSPTVTVPLGSVAQPPAAFRRAGEISDDILDLDDDEENQVNEPALGRTWRQFTGRRNALNRPPGNLSIRLSSDIMEESESIKSSDDEEDSILDSNSDDSSKSSSNFVVDSEWSEADEILGQSD